MFVFWAAVQTVQGISYTYIRKTYTGFIRFLQNESQMLADNDMYARYKAGVRI